MQQQTKENRNLLLCDYVTSGTVKPLIEAITRINREDDKNEKTFNGYDRNSFPITLTINSGGGTVYDGIALISAIEMSKTPVHTVAIGVNASMGLFIFVAGHKRYAHRLTTFMYHDVSYGQGGTVEQHERRMGSIKALKTKCIDFLLERTNLRKEELENMDGRVEDWYIDADEAVKLGIAHNKLVMHRLKKEDIQAGNFTVEG
jgi:ATP-dependent Clp protease, protease subunit